MSDLETKRVTAPDGVRTLLRASGPVDAPGVILIHGILHCSLVWKHQVTAPSLAGVRLVSYDIRGHGDADMPGDAAIYQPERFADELDAVITASGVARPILLGWSLGARMIFNYLEKYGAGRIGGLAIVGARVRQDESTRPASMSSAMTRNWDDDFATRLAARREFVRACHHIAPSSDDFADLVACAMRMPPSVLKHVAGRPMDYEGLVSQLTIPIHVFHGAMDAVCPLPLAERIPQLNPAAKLTVYEGLGHSPFFEQPERFNRDLLAFVRRCAGQLRN